MLKRFESFFCFILLHFMASAQPGTWTWINGDSIPSMNGYYVAPGVFDSANYPPGLYEPVAWQDNHKNLWIYGGTNFNFADNYGMWKYNPSLNQWMMVRMMNNTRNYGVKGVAAATNNPGGRSYGAPSWIDNNGNLWLLCGSDVNNTVYDDLWRYDTATTYWTWVGGSTTVAFPVSSYGTQGVPGPTNTPGTNLENNCTWVDANNDLWLFGGQYATTYSNDMWRYNIATNEWTWMRGDTINLLTGVYGTKGIAAGTNIPPGRYTYSKSIDKNGSFIIFGGISTGNALNDTWKYNPATNLWTWVHGTSVYNSAGNNTGTLCVWDTLSTPPGKYENKACATDECTNMWMYGGYSANYSYMNDLWVYNPDSNMYVLLKEHYLTQNGVWGIKGIPSVNNYPPSGMGNVAFCDSAGRFYIFGFGVMTTNLCNAIWRFDPANCVLPCNNGSSVPISFFGSSDTTFCEKQCIDFYDLSQNNPTSWQWTFTGAQPLSSTLQNPVNICYNSYGTFDVILVACNSSGCDSIVYTNFITEIPSPVITITQSNDTLYAPPALAYAWYQAGIPNVILGTSNFFVPAQGGSYYVVVEDSNGCETASNVISIPVTVYEASSQSNIITILHTQNNTGINILWYGPHHFNMLKIIDASGRVVTERNCIYLSNINIDTQKWAKGIYYIILQSDTESAGAKYLK